MEDGEDLFLCVCWDENGNKTVSREASFLYGIFCW